MKTKQRIINQAIDSYNAQGVMNVTSRDIAKTLNMSHGNLEYHFPNKEVLIMAIYTQMKDEISNIYEESKMSEDPIFHFNELLIALEAFQKKYSFFNLDVLEISRKYGKVSKLLSKTFQVRKEQMAHFYKHLMELGYLKEEANSGMYMRLQHIARILITFWNSQQEVLPYFETVQKSTMSTYIWELLIPHLTEKGLKAYKAMALPKS